MSFVCSDLDRVLREGDPAGMAAAIEHARACANCRQDLSLWQELSETAPALRKEWDSPGLWPRIEERLRTDRRRPSRPFWAWAAAAAILVVTVPSFWIVMRSHPDAAQARALLTDQALREAETAEAAYLQSIDKLAKVAEARLSKDPAPIASNYREKLLVLDSAIAELRSQAQSNRLNAHLRDELASLYRDKQQTLKEILTDETRRP